MPADDERDGDRRARQGLRPKASALGGASTSSVCPAASPRKTRAADIAARLSPVRFATQARSTASRPSRRQSAGPSSARARPTAREGGADGGERADLAADPAAEDRDAERCVGERHREDPCGRLLAVARRVEHRPARARRDCSVHEQERRGLEAQLRGRIAQLVAEPRRRTGPRRLLRDRERESGAGDRARSDPACRLRCADDVRDDCQSQLQRRQISTARRRRRARTP